jgi:methyltransferase-like protein/ubiquinone/menaquinone biosynthesis C-methylase UbiE
MEEPRVTSYDNVAYPSFPINYTHPDRLATVATLFGMKPVPVEKCRVLELGCSDGANLLAMAVGLPHSEFVGVDFAGTAIARGRALAAEVGLKNLTLRHLDLLEMAQDYGRFDYIIVHGLYTWVPQPVREQILSICKGSLAPHGIAYVSYNTLPGCYSRLMIREIMLFHNRDFSEPQQQMQQGMTLLKLLANSMEEPEIYTKTLCDEVERMSKRAKEALYHDELAEVFEPIYFRQFMDDARRHDLQFLGEADFFEMLPRGLKPKAKEVLDKISDDIVLSGQYLDFMRGRCFRKTLLCHPDVPLNRVQKPDCVKSYSVSSATKPDSIAPSFEAGAHESFQSGAGAKLTTADPLARALFWYLIERGPERIPFERLVTEVESRAKQSFGFVPKSDRDVRSDLAEFIWMSYSAGLLDLHVHVPPFVVHVSERPLASPLARVEARHGDVVSTLHHRSLKLGDSIQRGLIMLLDGTRDRSALRRGLKELFESGSLALLDENIKPVTDMNAVTKRIDDELDEVLNQIARTALLMG